MILTKDSFLHPFRSGKKNLLIACILLALLIGSLFYSVQLTVVLISLLFAYQLTVHITPSKYFSSKTFTAITSLIIYVVFLQFGSYVAWVFNKEASLLLGSLFALALLLILSLLLPASQDLQKRVFINRFDIISIIAIALVLVPLLAIPMSKSIKSGENVPVLNLITKAFDDSSHLAIFNDRVQFDRGVLSDSSSAPMSRFDGVGYPASWHSANAVFAKAAHPSIKAGIETAVYYSINKLFWFIILCFLFIRVAGSLLSLQSQKISFAASATLVTGSLMAITIFFADTFISGFYSFFPVILSTILLIPCAVYMYQQKDAKSIFLAATFPLLVISLSTLSWLLVLPMFGLGFLLILAEKYSVLKNVKQWNLKSVAPALYVTVLLIASTIIQIKALSVNHDGGAAGSFIDSILIPGGITNYAVGFYVLLLLLVALYVYGSKKSLLIPLTLYMAGVILFIAFIYIAQQYKLQTNAYYFYKSLGVFTTIAMTLGIVGLSTLIDRLNLKSKITGVAASLAIPLVLVMVFVPYSVLYTYAFNKDKAYSPVYNQLISQLSNEYSSAHYFDKSVTIYYPLDNPVLNEVGSMFLKSNRINNPCYPLLKNSSFTVKITEFNTSILKDPKCDGFSVTYLVEEKQINQFKNTLSEENVSDKVTVVPLAQ